MRHLVLAVLCTFLLISAAAADVAPGVTLLWYPSGQDYSSQCMVFLESTATLGYDHERGKPPEYWAGFWRENGVDGWDSSSRWLVDQDVPIPARGSSIVVSGLYAWQRTYTDYDTFSIYYVQDAAASPWEWRRTLRLVHVPDGVAYSGPFQWDLPLATTKGGDYIAVLPAYRTDDPLTGYRFEIEIEHVIPEPSSLLALVFGLAGLGAVVRRGRR